LHEQRALAGRIADSQLHVVPDVGHLVHYEAPAIAATAISSYVRAAT
jgi:pimeloyl-ACP methyl ester carboxylesterase